MSIYTATIRWKNDSPGDFASIRYTRGHKWEFDGGVTVPASSSPHSVKLPYSVEAAIDPEEAMVAAVSSCHMLTFLWLAANDKFNLESYRDDAVGEMATLPNGRQWLATITLNPQIEWIGDPPTSEQLADLHHRSHEQCYIANSIKSEVIIKDV